MGNYLKRMNNKSYQRELLVKYKSKCTAVLPSTKAELISLSLAKKSRAILFFLHPFMY